MRSRAPATVAPTFTVPPALVVPPVMVNCVPNSNTVDTPFASTRVTAIPDAPKRNGTGKSSVVPFSR